MTADDDPVRLRVVVAAPADVVFAWLTEPPLIGRWFGWEHDSLDDEIAMIFVDAASRSPSKLRFETNGGGLFLLEETPAGTVVELRRPAEDAETGAAFDAIDEGWTTFVQQLRLGVERHPDVERRAIELGGKLASDDAPRTWEALGLADAATLEVGAPYAATTPFGEELTGQVWFRSAHQLGLTVDGWGEGLLVAVQRPADDARPHGGVQLVLTSYGLDDDAFAEWFQRWTRWTRATLLD
ncbi:hypothetical protein [Patulibacter sp.]|uniref:hypothetical protein n=1 Tax=Patulibacter sp. TaxID=1912859 RepID=UPI0027292DD5|nr:hypothetical protein [Patulibacter sp.]MDO9408909.1 hypothetical protein [Patulibacter sp.]